MALQLSGPIRLSNIRNKYYNNDNDCIIDKFSTKSIEGCEAAYSLRLVRSNYFGPIIKVRRSSDSAELDFYASPYGEIGTLYYGEGTILNTWLNGSIGYINTLYDQSGKTRHLIQTTTDYQPSITKSGKDGEYTLNFNGYNTQFQITNSYLPSTMTSDNSGGYISSASSIFGSGYEAYKVFDNNTSTFWHSSDNVYNVSTGIYTSSVTTTDINGIVYSGEWIQIQLPSVIYLHTMSILPRQNSPTTRSPTSFVLLASNDSVSWNNIYYVSDLYWSSASKSFRIASTTNTYLYYRIVSLVVGNYDQASSRGSIQIASWELNSTTPLRNGENTYSILAQWRPDLYNRSSVTTAVSTWTGRTSVNETTIWSDICWSSDLGLFCAVGYYTSAQTVIMTSPDGVNWTGRTSSNNTNKWHKICWSSELDLFCATSFEGTNNIMTSPDGITWTGRTAPGDSSGFHGICWSPQLNLFVVCSINGTYPIVTSTNGINWTGQTAGFNPYAICWSPELNLFVAVSSFNTMNSSNGINWTTNNWTTNNSGSIVSIAWSPDLSLFVACSDAETQVSSNGINWTAVSVDTIINFSCICWSSQFKMFLAIAENDFGGSIIQVSYDGYNWIPYSPSSSLNRWNGVCWSPELSIFVSVGDPGNGGGTSNFIMTSVLNILSSDMCVIEQTSNPLSNNKRLSLIKINSNYGFSGYNNDACVIQLPKSYNTITTAYKKNVMIVNGSNAIKMFDNGILYSLDTGALSSLSIGESIFSVGMNLNGGEIFSGNITEIIIISESINTQEALIYYRPISSIKTLEPSPKPKYYLNFNPQSLVTPQTTSNIVAALDMNMLTNIPNGSKIFQWNGFTQTVGANKPTYYNKDGFRHEMGYASFTQGNPYASTPTGSWLSGGSINFNNLESSGFCVIGLVRMTNSATAYERIFDFVVNTGQNNGRLILYRSTGTGSEFSFYASRTNQTVSELGGLSLEQNEWAVFGIRYQYTGKYEIWKNGIFVNQLSGATQLDNRTANYTYIGRSNSTGELSSNMDLGAFYVYNRYLADSEFTSIMNSIPYSTTLQKPQLFSSYSNNIFAPTNFVYNIHTDDNSGGLVKNEYSVSLYGTSSNYIDFMDVPDLPISYCFWFNVRDTGSYTIIGLTDSNRGANGIQIDLNNGTLTLYAALPVSWSSFTISNSISINTWYNIIVTVNNNCTVQCYLNGTYINQAIGTGNLISRSRFIIGASGDTSRGFSGYISDFRIYDYLLNQEEITQIYSSGNGTSFMIQENKSIVPSQSLTYNNWHSTFTRTQYQGSYSIVETGVTPNIQLQLTDSANTNSTNIISTQIKIQSYKSFTMSFDLYISSGIGEALWVFIGSTTNNTTETSVNNGFNIVFKVSGTDKGVAIYNNSGIKVAQSYNTIFITDQWIPITITYNRGTINTWNIIVGYSSVLVYNDSNNSSWINTSGNYYGIGARTSSSTMNAYIRRYDLSYIPYASSLSGNGVTGYKSLTDTLTPSSGVNLELDSYDTLVDISSLIPGTTVYDTLLSHQNVRLFIDSTSNLRDYNGKKYIYILPADDRITYITFKKNSGFLNIPTFTTDNVIVLEFSMHPGTVNDSIRLCYDLNTDNYTTTTTSELGPGFGFTNNTGLVLYKADNTSFTIPFSFDPTSSPWFRFKIIFNIPSNTISIFIRNELLNPNGIFTAIPEFTNILLNLNNTLDTAQNATKWNCLRIHSEYGNLKLIKMNIKTFTSTDWDNNFAVTTLVSSSVLRSDNVPGLIGGLTWKYYDKYIHLLSTYDTLNQFNYKNIGRCINTSNLNNITNGCYTSDTTPRTFHFFGYLKVTKTGTWSFKTYLNGSDDNARLWIGDSALVYSTALSNHLYVDGSTKTATISLTAGNFYSIRFYFTKNTTATDFTFSFTPPGGSETSDGTGYFYSSIGVVKNLPAESAKVIKEISNINKDGIYYINCNGISTATHCLMNDIYNGGGWMLLMKGTRGTTFSYSTNYWTTTNTLNPTSVNRTIGDAKYNVFNYTPVKDILTIWPDIASTASTNIYGKNGGSINIHDGWTWKLDNWFNVKYPHLPMASNTLTVDNITYTITESSTLNSSWAGWKAFNNLVGDEGWHSNSPLYNGSYTGGVSTSYIDSTGTGGTASGEYIQMQLSSAQVFTKLVMYNRVGYTSIAPVGLVIVGSNNGSNWYLLYQTSNTGSWTNSVPKIVEFTTNISSYTYYRIITTSVGSGSLNVSLSEIQFFGPSKSTPLNGFQLSRDVYNNYFISNNSNYTASNSPFTYNGFSSGIFSTQASASRHIIGGGSHWSSNVNARWGFMFNENGENSFLTCDAMSGIGVSGLSTASAGDFGTSGMNRTARFELYGR